MATSLGRLQKKWDKSVIELSAPLVADKTVVAMYEKAAEMTGGLVQVDVGFPVDRVVVDWTPSDDFMVGRTTYQLLAPDATTYEEKTEAARVFWEKVHELEQAKANNSDKTD
ncbi:MAG: hypothetical protein LBM73_01290 [Candidatus Nomurabacteria bacterium]|nr:hypothetical protein [Candidatus Nomurabacteria bacterium]